MMSGSRIYLAAMLLVVSLTSTPRTSRSAEFKNVKEINRSLTRDIGNTFDLDLIAKSPTFQSLRATGSRPLWNELLLASDDALLSVCGLLLIESENPNGAFDAAVRMVLNNPEPGIPILGVAARIIANGMPNADEKNQDLLTVRLSGPCCSSRSVSVLMGMFADAELERLIMSERTLELPCHVLALVVDEAKSRDGLLGNVGVAERLTKAVSQLAVCPGEARITYLQCVDPLPTDFSRKLLGVLTDDSVDNAMTLPLLFQFGESHKTVIEDAEKKASPQRRAFIQKFMNRTRAE
jgi:hypothetical protein